MRNHNFHSRNHWVVSNGTISTTNFFYSVVISLTKIIATKLKCLEVYFTTCIIVNTFNFCTIFLQDEFEFVSLKRTSSKSLREFKIKWNWNTVDTFLSWFVWFFNCLAYWVVNVNCLVGCIFNIKFIVTTKFELSCIDNWIVYFIFDEFFFRSCSDGTIFNFDVELVRHICTSNWIVSLDVWSVHCQFVSIVFIGYTNVLNVVCFSKLICIKPYLVNQFRTTFNSLGIQVFWFVVGNTISIWICVSFSVFICQLIVIIHQFSTSNIVFFFAYNEFFWLEFRCFWWCYFVVEFFIRSTVSSVTVGIFTTCWRYIGNSCQWMTILSHCHCNSCFHGIISHTKFFISWNDFFYSVDVCSNFCIVKWQVREGYVTSSIILYSFNNGACSSIFQYEAEFTCFKFTTCQFLSEVELGHNWSNNIVVEFSICRHSNCSV